MYTRHTHTNTNIRISLLYMCVFEFLYILLNIRVFKGYIEKPLTQSEKKLSDLQNRNYPIVTLHHILK